MADKYGIQFMVVPVDNEYLKAVPVPDDGSQVIFGCPSLPGCRVEVLSISWTAVTLPVDAADPVTVTLNFHDASADTDTALLTGAAGALGDLLSAAGISVANEFVTVWHGVQSMDPGDTIRFDLTVVTPTTAGEGGAFLVAFRIKEWNGQ
mgnify:CR=1 FL=1